LDLSKYEYRYNIHKDGKISVKSHYLAKDDPQRDVPNINKCLPWLGFAGADNKTLASLGELFTGLKSHD
jgi:hypothetical protein